MATAKDKVEKTETAEVNTAQEIDMSKALVDFYAFKDGNKYKDDIVVAVNGKVWRIQRGVHVRIPRYVADVLESSQRQDVATANMIERETSAYEAAARMLN